MNRTFTQTEQYHAASLQVGQTKSPDKLHFGRYEYFIDSLIPNLTGTSVLNPVPCEHVRVTKNEVNDPHEKGRVAIGLLEFEMKLDSHTLFLQEYTNNNQAEI